MSELDDLKNKGENWTPLEWVVVHFPGSLLDNYPDQMAKQAAEELAGHKLLIQHHKEHHAEMESVRDEFKHIKEWCLQSQAGLTNRDVADAVIRMCDDALANFK